MLKAKLIVVGGDAKAGEVNLTLPSTIGRGREASIVLPHPLVSRLHCEFLEKEGKLYVRDLESLNGTFINNNRITGEHVIAPQQLLTIGDVTFRVCYEQGAEVQATGKQVAYVGASDSVANLETQLISTPPESATSFIEVPSQPAESNDKETLHGPEESEAHSEDNQVVSVEIAESLSVNRSRSKSLTK